MSSNPDRFIAYGTMFKLEGPDSTLVECVQCGDLYPLKDLLEGELREDCCPNCGTTAERYWSNTEHRPSFEDFEE